MGFQTYKSDKNWIGHIVSLKPLTGNISPAGDALPYRHNHNSYLFIGYGGLFRDFSELKINRRMKKLKLLFHSNHALLHSNTYFCR